MKLLFFAQCADWMSRRDLAVGIPSPMSLGELMRNTPELAPLLQRPKAYRIAVNRAFADPDTEVRNGDEVAFLPPFSGG